ncbi:hypothetical protein AB0Q97_36875, partial [Streptomyces sp. NPDC088135]
MAARTGTRSTAKKKPPRKPTAPSQRRPAASAAPVPPSQEVREEAETRVADTRDRAADVLDLAREQAADETARLTDTAEETARAV